MAGAVPKSRGPEIFMTFHWRGPSRIGSETVSGVSLAFARAKDQIVVAVPQNMNPVGDRLNFTEIRGNELQGYTSQALHTLIPRIKQIQNGRLEVLVNVGSRVCLAPLTLPPSIEANQRYNLVVSQDESGNGFKASLERVIVVASPVASAAATAAAGAASSAKVVIQDPLGGESSKLVEVRQAFKNVMTQAKTDRKKAYEMAKALPENIRQRALFEIGISYLNAYLDNWENSHLVAARSICEEVMHESLYKALDQEIKRAQILALTLNLDPVLAQTTKIVINNMLY